MAATQSADYWNGVKGQFTDLLFDYGRSRLIDIEGANDDRNLTDRVDAREGSLTVPGTGVSVITLAVVAVLVVVAVVVAKKVL
jgi:hypothetical protein